MKKRDFAMMTVGALLLLCVGWTGILAVVQIKQTNAGLRIGTKAADLIGFYGTTPVVRQTVTNTVGVLGTQSQVVKAAATQAQLTQVTKAAATQAALTLSTANYDFLVADGSTQTVVVVTNVVIGTVWGFVSTTPQVIVTNTIGTVWGFATTTPQVVETNISSVAGFSNTNQLNQLINAGRNLGIWHE